MSGFLSTVSNVANLGSAISNLLFGGGGPISLGDFVFASFEVPERVDWGGIQKVVVHNLIGGGRRVDRLGFEPMPLTWTGVFLGSDATSRAAALQKLSFDGTEQRLVFAGSDYQVAVSRFTAEQFREFYVAYHIECTVTVDNNQNPPQGAGSSFLDGLNNDISSALGFNVGATLSAGMTAIKTTISAVQPVLGAVSAVFPGSKALLGISQGLNLAQGTISTVGGIANSALKSLTTIANGTGNLLGATTLAGALQAMPIIGGSVANIAAAANSGGFINRASANTADIIRGEGPAPTSTVNRFLPST